MREALAAIDPEVPLYQVQTLADIADSRLSSRHFAMSVFGLFATLAVLLGAVGIYGVVSYGVAQRTREIGVRMALGADRGALLRLVLGEGLRLTVPGIVLGLLGAALGSRLLESLLFEVRGVDLPTYAAVSGVLGLVCLVAMSVPALRATRVDPLTSIRAE